VVQGERIGMCRKKLGKDNGQQVRVVSYNLGMYLYMDLCDIHLRLITYIVHRACMYLYL
jgi:hypothetical protein